eukprot:COSAG05_NODE_23755_length_256_cov_0.477707_1_plen_27_part_01
MRKEAYSKKSEKPSKKTGGWALAPMRL